MRILGISAFYHDSAAAIIEDGHILAAVQEERFTRKKHDSRFPEQSIRYCIEQCPKSSVFDAVAFYDKPFRKFDRLIRTHLASAPHSFESFAASIPTWIPGKLMQGRDLKLRLSTLLGPLRWDGTLLFAEHHQSHAASAFYPSPFRSAVVLTMDGVGEWCTTSIAIGDGSDLKPNKELHFPHSIGLLYSAFTEYLGFRVNSGEYKVMGLAPYGTPKFTDEILREIVDLKSDGSFRLNQRYFNYSSGLSMTNSAFHDLFGGEPRKSESSISQRHLDIAASIQYVTEQLVLSIVRNLAREGHQNLCLAGGVALNCVANAKIAKEHLFERVWVQPAAGDAGGALGAAFAAYHMHFRQPRSVNSGDSMRGSYLGPSFSTQEAMQQLESLGAVLRVESDSDLFEFVAGAIENGLTVGWFQGRMEYGPRALGARSILADPRRSDMKALINGKIKFREFFRPFAPAVLAEHAEGWFDIKGDSPYMLMTVPVRPAKLKSSTAIEGCNSEPPTVCSEIPAVTHVDQSARIQTVHRETNIRFHKLLQHFYRRTGCPILLNTSFNIRGEPPVCTPEDALNCFLGTGLDILVVENCILEKSAQRRLGSRRVSSP